MSQHLKALEDAGLLRDRADGRRREVGHARAPWGYGDVASDLRGRFDGEDGWGAIVEKFARLVG